MDMCDKKLVNLASEIFDLSMILELYCQNNNDDGVTHLRPLAKIIRRLADDLYYNLAFVKED